MPKVDNTIPMWKVISFLTNGIKAGFMLNRVGEYKTR